MILTYAQPFCDSLPSSHNPYPLTQPPSQLASLVAAAQTGINVSVLTTSASQAEAILRESDLVRRFLALHPPTHDVIDSGKDPLQKERDDLAKFKRKMEARREKKRKEEERKKRLYSSGGGGAKKKS